MKHLTIRDVSPTLAHALEKEARERALSLNQTVKDLLERALGLGEESAYDNGLGKFAGGWTDEDLKEFEAGTANFETIDYGEWK